jgi:diadenosine tetraphosphate (Ap4A) HIT family hydrolase
MMSLLFTTSILFIVMLRPATSYGVSNTMVKSAILRTPPPPGVDYSDNPTVFGKILRGEASAAVFIETEAFLAFRDIQPRAPFHALIIPKGLVESVFELTDLDVVLLDEMTTMAQKLVQESQPTAYADQDYLLCFHIPPFNSVQHLHLHVLAPMSQLPTLARLKYQVGTRWCISSDQVTNRLQAGQTAVPYTKWRFADFMQPRGVVMTLVLVVWSIWMLLYFLS